MVKGKTKMSTYRYRDAAGDINIAAKNLTADTATIADLEMNTFTVKAFEPVSSQGLHLQWSKNTDGAGYIINQKGGGTGGVKIGSVTAGDAITLGLEVRTDVPASSTVLCSTARIDVTGVSVNNTALNAAAFSANTTAANCAVDVNCSAGGLGLINFREAGADKGRIYYDATTESLIVDNLALGPVHYQGQIAGTVVQKPTQYLGGSVGSPFPIAATGVTSIRNVAVAVFDAGTKVSLSLPSKGHWLVGVSANIVSVVVAGVAVVELWVGGSTFSDIQTTTAGAASYLGMSDSWLLDNNAAAPVLLEVKTSGAVTSGNSSEFYIYAVRLG